MSFTKKELEAIAMLQPVKANTNQVDMDAMIARAHQLRSEYVHDAARAAFKAVFGGLAAAYRTRRDYNKAVNALEAMTDRELKDLGITRGDIRQAVRGNVPAAPTFAQKLVKAFAPLFSRYNEWRSRREGYAQLMAMDSRQLSDIGLTRGDVAAAVAGKAAMANDNVVPAANNNDGRRAS